MDGSYGGRAVNLDIIIIMIIVINCWQVDIKYSRDKNCNLTKIKASYSHAMVQYGG